MTEDEVRRIVREELAELSTHPPPIQIFNTIRADDEQGPAGTVLHMVVRDED